MADNTQSTDQGQQALTELQTQNATLRSEKAGLEKQVGELQERVDSLQAELDRAQEESAAGGPAKVPGSVNIKVETTEGKQRKVKLAIRAGRRRIRLSSGQPVASAAFMKLAMGRKLSAAETDADPALKDLTPEDARDWLTELYLRGASLLEEV